jgi:anti-sigma-K factor RskA
MNQPLGDIHALSGAYAVDALDDTERAEFELHLAECAACRAEVASFRETTALVAETEAVTPPESLRDGVLAGIRQIRPLPPETPETAETAEAAGTAVTPATPGPADELAVRRRRLPTLLVAAAAVVLIAFGAVLWHPWQHDQTSAVDQVLQASDAVRITEPVPGGGELTLVRSASLDKAVLVGRDVPDAPAGKTYQMWLQNPGEAMVSAGLMPDADEPTVLDGEAATAAAAAVSIEPANGSDHPSKDVVAVFPLTPESGNGAS